MAVVSLPFIARVVAALARMGPEAVCGLGLLLFPSGWWSWTRESGMLLCSGEVEEEAGEVDDGAVGLAGTGPLALE